jgi:hypothetical protein
VILTLISICDTTGDVVFKELARNLHVAKHYNRAVRRAFREEIKMAEGQIERPSDGKGDTQKSGRFDFTDIMAGQGVGLLPAVYQGSDGDGIVIPVADVAAARGFGRRTATPSPPESVPENKVVKMLNSPLDAAAPGWTNLDSIMYQIQGIKLPANASSEMLTEKLNGILKGYKRTSTK